MRFLHRRHDHDGDGPERGESPGSSVALKGNLCRCTGYHAIEDAIRGIKSIEEPAAGAALGASVAAPAAEAIVTGKARYTLDTAIDGLLHLKLLRSPHAHARITVHWQGAGACGARGTGRVHLGGRPATAVQHCHSRRLSCDPDDTYMLDNVVRLVGQRVAAVVADSEAAAEEGCRKLEVEYEILPAVFDPEEAMSARRPGTPRQGRGISHPAPGAKHPARVARRRW